MINGTEGGEVIHNFGFAAEGADGEAAPDDLAEGGEVGGDAGAFLHSAGGEAESGHHFIKNEEGAVVGAEAAECFEVAGFGEDESAIGGIGFEDDGGDLLALLGEAGLGGSGVVVFKDDGFGSKTGGDAGAVGVAEREGTGSGFDEEGINVTVITTGEFDDFIAPGESARKAHGREGGLGSAIAHADFFDGGNHGDDVLRHCDFIGVGGAEAGAPVEGGGKGGVDVGVVVPVDGGTPGADVVDEFASVAGMELGTFGAGGEEGVAADGAEGADGGVDSAGHECLSLFEEGG